MKTNNQSKNTILRQKAEELLLKEQPKKNPKLSETEALEFIHELEVHQIELEMQNDELIHANKLVEYTTEKYAGFAKKYAELYDFAPSGYFTLSRDGDILGLNLRGAKMLGKDRLRLINNRFSLYVSDDTKLNFNLFFDKVFVNKTNQNCKVVLVVNSNLPMYVQLAGAISANGEQCLVTAVDITQGKLEEESGITSALRYQTLLQTGSDGIHVLDEKGNVLEANMAFCNMLGYTKEELLQLNVTDWDAQWSKEMLLEKIGEIISHPIVFETKHRRKDGTILDVEINVTGVVLEGCNYLYAAARDITERKQAEKALQDSEEKFRNAFHASPDAISMFSANTGKILDINEGFTKIFGFNREEAIGKTSVELGIVKSNEERENILTQGDAATGKSNVEFIFYNKKNEQRIGLTTLKKQQWKNEECVFSVTKDITESTKEKELLIISENKFRSLFENINVGILKQGPNAEIIISNEAALEMLGLTKDQLLGKTSFNADWNVIHEDSSAFPGPTHPVPVAIETQKPVRDVIMGVYRPKTKDRVWLLVNAIPEFDLKGKLDHVICTFVNITERKQAEEKLRRSEENFKKAFAMNPDAISINRLEDGVYVSINDGFTKTTGYSEEEVIGKTSLELNIWYSPEDRKMFGRSLMENEEVRNLEARFRMKNGDIISTLLSASVIELNGSSHIISIIKDINELKHAQAAITASALRYQTLLQTGSDGIHVLDEQGNVLEANMAFCNMLGYTKEELLQLNVTDWDLQWSRERLLANIGEMIRHPMVFETKHHRKDGTLLDVEINVAGVVLEGRNYLYAAARDITERKQAETIKQEIMDRFLKIASRVPGILYQYRLRPDGTSCFPFASEAIKEIYRVSPEEVREDASRVFANIHPDDYNSVVASIMASAQNLTPWQHDYRVKFEDGTIRSLHGNAIPEMEEDGSVLWHGFITDITERKLESDELVKLNRLYALISQINNLILRTDNREKLFIEVCNMAIIYGKFRMAWIGLVDDITHTVNPVASAGFEDGYLKIIKKISNKDIPEGRGPSGRAIREGKTVISNDIANDPAMEPWRKEAIQRGYYSSISLPIIVHNKSIGTFVLYADEPNFFSNEEEVALLEKITNNISFSLETILTNEERRKAKAALTESEERYRALIDWTPEGIAVHREGKLLYVNPAAIKMLGATSSKELIGKYFIDMIHPDFHEITMEGIRTISKVGSRRPMLEEKFIRFDGKEIDVEVQGIVINYKGEPAIQSSVHDITERKRAEEKLRQLSQAVEQSPISIVITDKEGTIQYVNSKFVEITGYSFDEAIGKNPSILKSGHTSDLE